jgi:hypothetical protein
MPSRRSRTGAAAPSSTAAAISRMRARRLEAQAKRSRRTSPLPLTPQDTELLARLSPSERDAYKKDAAACANVGVSLSPRDWLDGEAYERALTMLRLVPDDASPEARENLVNAIVAACPALKHRGRTSAAHLHNHVQAFGFIIAAPASLADPDLRQFLAANATLHATAVYVREPAGPNLTKGFRMLRPRDAPLPSRDRLRATGRPTRRLIYEEMGWRRF